MDIPTTIKYLDFVSNECERHLGDGNVSDDELNQLIIEYQRFLSTITNSKLPLEIKNEIKSMKFDYSAKKVKRSSFYILVSILTFGSIGYLLAMQRQSKRKKTLEDLKRSSSTLSFNLRLNY